MTVVVTYFIGIAALVAAAWQFVKLKRSPLVRADPMSSISIFVLVCGSLLFEIETFPGGAAAQIAFVVVLAVAVFGQIIFHLRKRSSLRPRALVFIPAAISALLFFINAVMNSEQDLSKTLGRSVAILSLALIALMVTASVLSLKELCDLTVLGISLAYSLSFLSEENWRPCDQFKCGPFDAIYTGFAASENTIAIICGIGILCTLVGRRGQMNWAALGLFWFVLYATESRTSQIAVVASVVAWPVGAMWARRLRGNAIVGVKRQGGAMFPLLLLTLAALFAVGFSLLVNAQPSDFSNRGSVWMLGLAALDGDWIGGLGLDRWSALQAVGLVPAHFPHSQYLVLLFAGGVLGVIGLFLLFAVTVRVAMRAPETLPFAVSYIALLCVLGMTEMFWNPLALDGNALVILPVIFILAGKTLDGAALHADRGIDSPDTALLGSGRFTAPGIQPVSRQQAAAARFTK